MSGSSFARTRDGRRLHYVSRGTGSPTVVFEAGLAAGRGTWGLVQPAVASAVRTVAYDRAGLGRSDEDPAPRTLERMADDLEDLLTCLGDGAYVMVGHSLGGPLVRLLAYRRPELVAGLVLVDQVAEECTAFRRSGRTQVIRGSYLLVALMAQSGLLHLLAPRLYRRLPPELAAEVRAEQLAPTAFRTGARELAMVPGSLTALLARRRDRLPEIPVTLISADRSPLTDRRLRSQLIASHRRLAASLPQGRHVMAPATGHLIPWHHPESVITEIHHLLNHLHPPSHKQRAKG